MQDEEGEEGEKKKKKDKKKKDKKKKDKEGEKSKHDQEEKKEEEVEEKPKLEKSTKQQESVQKEEEAEEKPKLEKVQRRPNEERTKADIATPSPNVFVGYQLEKSNEDEERKDRTEMRGKDDTLTEKRTPKADATEPKPKLTKEIISPTPTPAAEHTSSDLQAKVQKEVEEAKEKLEKELKQKEQEVLGESLSAFYPNNPFDLKTYSLYYFKPITNPSHSSTRN